MNSEFVGCFCFWCCCHLDITFLVSQGGQPNKAEKKNKVSSTRKTVIENGDMDHHDNDDTETLIGSQFSRAKSHDRDNINMNGIPSLANIGAPKRQEPDGE